MISNEVKNSLIIIAVIVLALLGIVYYMTQKPDDYSVAPVPQNTVPQDNTAAINNDVEAIDLGDVDMEFKSIDSDLNSL